jgi:hypothetical protein
MSLRLQRKFARATAATPAPAPLQVPWYKQSIGSWPYSFDVMDILRGVIPQAVLGGIAGKLAKNVWAGAAFGATAAALSRAQIWIELRAYPEEFKPEVSTGPGYDAHNAFLIAFESALAALGGALITWALKGR